MRGVLAILGLLSLAGCGSDIASSGTAEASRQNVQSRIAAQGPTVYNPGVMTCVRQTATESEKRALAVGGAAGDSAMVAILNRKETRQCMKDNNVVIYL